MKVSPPPIVILGAGLQGTCIALELARRGREVLLLERDSVAMNRASLRNEGKIHLGLIYANDPTLATGGLQLEGALRFRGLLKRWIGARADELALSTPFYYLIAGDSLLTPQELGRHYDSMESLCRERLEADPQLDYLGRRPGRLHTRIGMDRVARHFSPGHFQGAHETAERAVDPLQLAEFLRAAVEEDPNIQFLPSHKVLGVERRGESFRVEGMNSGETFRIEARQVVNATWENRTALDRTAGIEAAQGLLHRLKYRIIARLPGGLHGAPSATMVLGRYGDVVIRPDGTAYLSWYPAGLRGWSHEVRAPDDWDEACRGVVDDETARELTGSFLAAIGEWFPGIGRAEPLLVDAGVVVAHGRTDVDDPASGLHDRSRIGVTSRDGYHSVDPGKLTTAPMFAVEAADRVMSCDDPPCG